MPSCVTGILFGPLVANVINPFEWVGHDTDTFIDFTMQLSRIVIGLQVLFTGVNLPKQYIRKEWLSLTMLLLPIMTCAWLSVGLLIWALIPGLSYLEALVISACVVPTDPVLANSICKGSSTVTRDLDVALRDRQIRRDIRPAQSERPDPWRIGCERRPWPAVPDDGNLPHTARRAGVQLVYRIYHWALVR